jgi:hypothetical protein
LLDKKITSNGWVGTVGDLWKCGNAKFKGKKQDKLILILRFYLKTKKTRNSVGSSETQNIRDLYHMQNTVINLEVKIRKSHPAEVEKLVLGNCTICRKAKVPTA